MGNINLDQNWKNMSDVKYIGAYAFDDGEVKTVTITDVNREVVIGNNGSASEMLVVYFAECKPLVLNRTNAKIIDKVCHTRKMSGWIGHKIMLYVDENVRFGRNVVAGVRVKDEEVKIEIPPCAVCGKAITNFGKVPAYTIYQSAMSKFGKPMCAECGKKQ